MQDAAQTKATQTTQVDADLASDLIASRATTQPPATVIEVLAARHDGASINAAANTSGINYRTAQRIVEAAAAYGSGSSRRSADGVRPPSKCGEAPCGLLLTRWLSHTGSDALSRRTGWHVDGTTTTLSEAK